MKNIFLTLSKCMVNVMFFCGVPITIAVPFLLKWYSKINEYYEKYYILQTLVFFINGVFACLIVYELRKMIKSVELENCFIRGNVHSLRRMGIYSFVIAVMCFVRSLIYITPGSFAMVVVFVIAGMFSEVLAGVFDQAVTYKEDNDLTI